MFSRISMRALSFGQSPPKDELFARLERGDPAAVGELYDAHHEALRAFGGRLLGDEAAAEDLVHEVFVRLPTSIANFRGDSSLRTFLMGIAVNHARHFVRSAQRKRQAMSRLAREPAANTDRPDHNAEKSAILQALQRAMDTLPLEQRVAFTLCDVEECSAAEASRITGAPEATMRTRLHHARKKLRTALEQEGVR
jgi:RNA polymerase sigma-70 factor (ECF subfamily)